MAADLRRARLGLARFGLYVFANFLVFAYMCCLIYMYIYKPNYPYYLYNHTIYTIMGVPQHQVAKRESCHGHVYRENHDIGSRAAPFYGTTCHKRCNIRMSHRSFSTRGRGSTTIQQLFKNGSTIIHQPSPRP